MVEAATVRSLLETIEARLAAMAGFSNVLAHGYAELKPELVHANLARLDDVRAYLRALQPRLSKVGGAGEAGPAQELTGLRAR